MNLNSNIALIHYPFGMPMPGRNSAVSGGEYRYGFNGMEKDDEVKGQGNSYDFGARIYDNRLGRWLSVDPFVFDYPQLSGFTFVANSPLIYIDPDGKRIRLVGKGTEELFKKYLSGFDKKNKKSEVRLSTWDFLKIEYDENGYLTSKLTNRKGKALSPLKFYKLAQKKLGITKEQAKELNAYYSDLIADDDLIEYMKYTDYDEKTKKDKNSLKDLFTVNNARDPEETLIQDHLGAQPKGTRSKEDVDKFYKDLISFGENAAFIPNSGEYIYSQNKNGEYERVKNDKGGFELKKAPGKDKNGGLNVSGAYVIRNEKGFSEAAKVKSGG